MLFFGSKLQDVFIQPETRSQTYFERLGTRRAEDHVLESLVTPSAATSLAAEARTLMVGANDRSVLSYDLRTPARLLSAIKTHGDSVVSILLQPGSVGNLVATGSSSGDVHFVNLRNLLTTTMVNVSGKPVT